MRFVNEKSTRDNNVRILFQLIKTNPTVATNVRVIPLDTYWNHARCIAHLYTLNHLPLHEAVPSKIGIDSYVNRFLPVVSYSITAIPCCQFS